MFNEKRKNIYSIYEIKICMTKLQTNEFTIPSINGKLM